MFRKSHHENRNIGRATRAAVAGVAALALAACSPSVKGFDPEKQPDIPRPGNFLVTGGTNGGFDASGKAIPVSRQLAGCLGAKKGSYSEVDTLGTGYVMKDGKPILTGSNKLSSEGNSSFLPDIDGQKLTDAFVNNEDNVQSQAFGGTFVPKYGDRTLDCGPEQPITADTVFTTADGHPMAVDALPIGSIVNAVDATHYTVLTLPNGE